MIWKSPSFCHKHCNTVGRQCGPNLLDISESTIRGPLHLSPVNWASSVSEISPFFSSEKISTCSYGLARVRNFYKEKGGEARFRKPSQLCWPGPYEEPPKQLGRSKTLKLHILYGPWGEENKLSLCYLLPILCGANISGTPYSHGRLALPLTTQSRRNWFN